MLDVEGISMMCDQEVDFDTLKRQPIEMDFQAWSKVKSSLVAEVVLVNMRKLLAVL